MAKYELDLHIALIFLSEEEVEQFKTMVQPRQERFGECGLLETNINIFKVKEPTSSSKVALPEIPVTVTEISSRSSTVEKDVDDIQRILLADFSDDEEEEVLIKSKDDEKLLIDDNDLGSPIKGSANQLSPKEVENVFQTPLENDDSDDGIEILEVFEKEVPTTIPLIKKEIKKEVPEISVEKLPPPSTPSPSPEPSIDNLYELKIEGDAEYEEMDQREDLEDNVETIGNLFCRICYTSFESQLVQLSHERKVHNNPEDQAALNKDFTKLSLDDFSHSCHVCGLKFLTDNCINIHLKKGHRIGLDNKVEKSEIECNLCYKTFSYTSQLKVHIKVIHKKDEEFLGREIVSSELKHPCKRCPKKFVKESILGYHKRRVHSEKDKYKGTGCRLCYKIFSFSSQLKAHAKAIHKNDEEFLGREIESSELKHPCNSCEKKFVKKSILGYHKKRAHLEKDENEGMECMLCYKKIRYLRNFNAHIQGFHKNDKEFLGRDIHESELKFACKICPKKFVTRRILTKHNVEHYAKKYKTMVTECYMQGTKRYKCKFCHANFDGLGVFLNHTILKHSTEEYLFNVAITPEQCQTVCSKCDLMFVSQSVLEYHTD